MTEEENPERASMDRLLLDSYLEFERKNEVGKSPTLISRTRRFLEYFGAVQLGLFIACFSIFLNFLVVNLILHL